MTIKECQNVFYQQLADEYDRRAIGQYYSIFLKDALNIDPRKVITDPELELETKEEKVNDAVLRLLKHEPIQYICSKAWFYGRPMLVSKDVLIPRPETEELVELIIRQQNKRPDLKILDIGTGSGCIAIVLSLELTEAKIFATDVSAAALKVAAKNASNLHATVNWLKHDVFKSVINELPDQLDVLVSNPPYITRDETQLMSKSALAFEPQKALFTGADSATVFYERIGKLGLALLKPEGQLYFELNEFFADATAELIRNLGYENVELHKDMQHKDRMLSATKPA